MRDSWYDLYCEEVEKNEKLKKELKQAKAHALSLERRLAYMEKNQEKMEETAECICKDEFDFEVVLKKKRHRFVEMRCRECGHVERAGIPKHLKEENQYGYGVQALALTMMNKGYVLMARTKGIIEGITSNEMRLSVGYIAKLQKRLYGSLAGYHEELRRSVSRLPIVH